MQVNMTNNMNQMLPRVFLSISKN